MHTRVGGGSHTVGVIGWPVSGSLSPVIHNTAFAALGLDWVYVPLPVPPDGLRRAIAGLSALGFTGANVTMPHKTEAAELMDQRSEDAERLQAVNTIVVNPDGLAGHNTDVAGFERFLRADAGFEATGRSALIFGGWGAARACALALARLGVTQLSIALRDPAKDGGVRRTLDGFDVSLTVVTFDRASLAEVDLVVNATPLGARGERLPVPKLGPGDLVVDLLYRPSTTPLQADAKLAGAAAFGGLGLLLHQAALSFELWTGQIPPLQAMSAAAVAELTEPGDEGPSAGA